MLSTNLKEEIYDRFCVEDQPNDQPTNRQDNLEKLLAGAYKHGVDNEIVNTAVTVDTAEC